MTALEYAKVIIKNNWQEFQVPIFLAFFIPFMAYLFGQLNIFVGFSSLWLLFTAWQGMVNQDVAVISQEYIRCQERTICELLYERFGREK